jgi:nucleoid-associated protein YgaU
MTATVNIILRTLKRLVLPALAVTMVVSCSREGDGPDEVSEPTLAPELVIVTPTPIPPGATVVITPTPTVDPATLRTHTVEAGETLSSIADLYNVTAEQIQELNGIDDPSSIQAGQELLIPPG